MLTLLLLVIVVAVVVYFTYWNILSFLFLFPATLCSKVLQFLSNFLFTFSVLDLNNHISEMGEIQQQFVYDYFIYPFLSRKDISGSCFLKNGNMSFKNTTNCFIWKYEYLSYVKLDIFMFSLILCKLQIQAALLKQAVVRNGWLRIFMHFPSLYI